MKKLTNELRFYLVELMLVWIMFLIPMETERGKELFKQLFFKKDQE